MQYKPETEKAAMMDTVYTPVVQPISLANDPQIERTRKVFIIILGVCLALTAVSLVTTTFTSGNEYSQVQSHRGSFIGQAVVGILSYGFGILVAYKYSSIGLRIFAWFCIIELVFLGIAVVIILGIIIIAVVAMSTTADKETPGLGSGVLIGASIGGFIFVVIFVAAFVLSIIIAKLAFKLARLIEANKRVIIPQV